MAISAKKLKILKIQIMLCYRCETTFFSSWFVIKFNIFSIKYVTLSSFYISLVNFIFLHFVDVIIEVYIVYFSPGKINQYN